MGGKFGFTPTRIEPLLMMSSSERACASCASDATASTAAAAQKRASVPSILWSSPTCPGDAGRCARFPQQQRWQTPRRALVPVGAGGGRPAGAGQRGGGATKGRGGGVGSSGACGTAEG